VKRVHSPGRITVTIAAGEDKPPMVMTLRRPWIALVAAGILALLAGIVLAVVTYLRTIERLENYAALSVQVDDLRHQNERLSDLETELQELLLFQDRIMNLAGVESALRPGPDSGDNRGGLFDPDSTWGTGLLLVWPVTGKRIRQHGDSHVGVDIAAVPGQTVMAAGAGEVVGVEAEGASGFRLRIAHGDSLVTVYANLKNCQVAVGDHVQAGQGIARVGSGFEGSEGHLHFEVYEGGKAVPPEDFVRRLTRS
jgi:murein DD-endopeptidase MepM/ murein hydrolase activator NlpD